MATTFISWRDFVPQIQLAVQACPMQSMLTAIRQAAIKFCKESKVWRQEGILVSAEAGTRQYEITPPDNADISAIDAVEFDGTTLHPMSAQEMREKADQDGTPTHYIFTEPLTITLWPTPDVSLADGISVDVALQPKHDSSQGPQFLLARYEEGVVSKAKAILMMIPNKSWTNPQLAGVCDSQFRREVNATKVSVLKGGTNRSLRVKRRTFV